MSTPESQETGHKQRPVLWLALLALATLAVDLGTKIWALSALEGREPVRLLGGALYLSFARNTGAAFSLASGYTVVLTVVSLTVVAVIIRFAARLRSMPWAIALGLILGGATGNLVDRLFRAPGPLRGAVIDFLSLFDKHGDVWPIFNFADSALVCGVALAVVLELTGRRLNGTRVVKAEKA
ncbi:signal peptidase II [Longispora sp. NPDC051575]|uniref:signal peptidase II n=1 Tax=Longispora sp. NPDC051575 TaxID=3154943 RepID=UPI00344A1EA3